MTETHTAGRRETVPVSLGERSYDIHIGEGLLAKAGDIVAPFLRRPLTAIVTDENVARAHLATLERALAARGIRCTAIVLPPGEGTKSYRHLAELCDKLLAAGIERRDPIIAFGGGVIGDLAGFAAAILRRGVDFIQIPTTLLSQVDSSVGGKTGINSPHGKNLIGAFHQPLAVITDIDLLGTLPRRELAAGYAEVAKYGLLGDPAFFEWLEEAAPLIMRGDAQARIHAIRKSCEAKAEIVAEDEHETGVRALLNRGHTFGHKLAAMRALTRKAPGRERGGLCRVVHHHGQQPSTAFAGQPHGMGQRGVVVQAQVVPEPEHHATGWPMGGPRCRTRGMHRHKNNQNNALPLCCIGFAAIYFNVFAGPPAWLVPLRLAPC